MPRSRSARFSTLRRSGGSRNQCGWAVPRASCVPSFGTLKGMSVVEEPRDPVLVVVQPDEALRRARPLPSADDLRIEGLTPEEWRALNAVLAER